MQTPPEGWLGTPVLIPGEEAIAYDQFAGRLRDALQPSNAIEEIFVDDAIAHGWEVRRWRRGKGGLLLAGSHAGLARALLPIVGKQEADLLAQGWAKREPTVVAKVEAIMAGAKRLPQCDCFRKTSTIHIGDDRNNAYYYTFDQSRRSP